MRIAAVLAGLVWAGLMLRLGVSGFRLPPFVANFSVVYALALPGLVLALLVVAEGAGLRAARVARQATVVQIVVALALWPATGQLLNLVLGGGGVIIVLGLSLALMRLVHWAGAAFWPPLRVFASAASLWPSLLAFGFAAGAVARALGG